MDAPLAELIGKRQLEKVGPWLQRWESGGRRALSEGRMADAVPLLEEAQDYDGRVYEAVREAQTKLAALVSAVQNTEVTARALEREGAEPAIEVLIELGTAVGHPVDERRDPAVRGLKAAKSTKDWKKATTAIRPAQKRLEAGREYDKWDELLAELDALDGRFPRELAAALRAADGDDARRKEILSRVDDAPVRWLIADYFNW
jgi:hypothetical protein